MSGGSVVVTPAETTFVLTRQIRIEGVDVDVMVEVVADRLLGEGEVGVVLGLVARLDGLLDEAGGSGGGENGGTVVAPGA